MRRKDRQITDKKAIIEILDECEVCRLGLCYKEQPYIVPMSYGYTFSDNQLILYFHSAKEGKKIAMLEANPNGYFEVDCAVKLIEKGDDACNYSMSYKSVMGSGKIENCENLAEKEHGLQVIMSKYAAGKKFTFTENQLNAVYVFKMVVSEFSGKSLPYTHKE